MSRVEIGDIKNAAGDSTTRYGIAAGNNLALTPATGFSGFTVDNVYGARLYNGLLEMYTGGSKFLGIDSTNGIEVSSNSANVASDQRGLTFLDGATTVAGLWGFHSPGGQISLQMGAVGSSRDVQTLITSVSTGGYDRRTTIAADGPSIEVRRSPADAQTISLTAASGVTINGGTAWHSGNDGAGSGLDADTLDTYHASAFGRLTASQTWTATNQFTYLGVGIAPTQILQVHGASGSPATSGTAQNGIAAISNDNSYATLYVGTYTASPYAVWLQASARNALGTNHAIALNPNGGGVVVGTTEPLYSAALSVSGNIHSTGAVTGEGFMQLYHRASSPGAGGSGWGRLWLKDIGSGKVQLRLQTNTGDYLIVGDP